MTDAILVRSADLSKVSLDDIISVLEKNFKGAIFIKTIDDEILSKIEDLEDAKAGQEAYEEYLRSGKKSYSADEVFKMAGIKND